MLATYPLSAAGQVAILSILLAALALLVLGAAQAMQRPALLPLAVVILAAEYLTVQAIQWPAIDPVTPFYAAGLLLLAEIGSWSLEPHWLSREDPDLNRRRVLRLSTVVLAAILLDAALLLAAAIPVVSSLALTAVGAAGAVGGLAVVAVVARSARGATRP